MHQQEKIMSLIRRMDQIHVRPRISAGFSLHDKKTGSFTDPGSVTVSFGTSLLRWAMLLTGGMLALFTWMWLCRLRRERKIREKYRKKLRRAKKK